jgi:hypothetical protein
MTTASATRASGAGRVDPLVPRDFSLFRGGLLYAIGVRLGLVGDDRRLLRLGLALAALTWLPLALLNTFGDSPGHQSIVPFWQSIGTHARLLVTIPLFFLAEDLFDMRVADVLRRILQIGLILPADQERFGDAVRKTIRTRDSWAVEVALFAMTIGLVWFGFRKDLPPGLTTWRGTLGSPTMAGWWYAIVSIPLFQFLLWRWVWRWMVWTALVWRLSRLNLQLIPTHPDGAGGLAVLGVAHVDLAPLAFGASAILSSSYAEQMLFAGVALSTFVVSLVASVVGSTLTLVLPLVFFMPQLVDTRQRALLEYGGLAAEYTRAFGEKWVQGQRPAGEHLLGSADIQSLADLAASYHIIRSMMIVPMARYQMMLLAGAAILPFAPLLLLAFPLDELIINSVKSVLSIP